MKLFLALMIATLTGIAQAEVIECSFTEPFFSLKFNSETRTMTKTEPNWDTGTDSITTTVGTNMTFRKLRDEKSGELAHFSRYGVYNKGRRVLTLTLNYNGTDGMSDLIFPYLADAKATLSPTGEKVRGGCETEKLEAITPAVEEAASN